MIRSINNSRKDYLLLISGVSWKKNYHNLFDYDQHSPQSLLQFSFQLPLQQTFFLIFRNKTTFQLSISRPKQLTTINEDDLDKTTQLVCGGRTIVKEKHLRVKFYQPDDIIRENAQTTCGYNQHFVVVRAMVDEDKEPIGFKLRDNLVIKLGNCEFFVHSVSNKNQDDNAYESMEKLFETSKNDRQQQQLQDDKFFIRNNERVYNASLENNDPEAECKYCMMPEGQQIGQFLCSPCKCSGSCGLVHFNCLVKWNQSKVKKTQNKGCVEYNFQKFFCEVCKQQYPQYIKKNNKNHELLPMQKPKDNYMILQALNSLKRHIIIVSNTQDKEIIIGRGHECDIKLQDPTISRRHAVIKREGNQFVLFDLKSKFGTLVKDINLIVPLNRDNKFSIQAGRSVISFSLVKKSVDLLFQS